MDTNNICTKCGSTNTNIQTINQVFLKKKGKGCLYWFIIGWWLELILWIFFTIPRLLFALFSAGKQKTVNKTKTMRVCQDCGSSWEVK